LPVFILDVAKRLPLARVLLGGDLSIATRREVHLITTPRYSFSKLCSQACLLLAATASGVFACSSDGKGGGAQEILDTLPQTGSMRLKLTARGSSGALYRLRQATFQVERLDGGGVILPPAPGPVPIPQPLPFPEQAFPDVDTRPLSRPTLSPSISQTFPDIPPSRGGAGPVDGGVAGAGGFGEAGSASTGGFAGTGVGGSAGAAGAAGAGPSSSFVTFLSTENDPLSTTLEASLPGGQFLITLFDGWFLEKVQGGEVTAVDARLVSPQTLDFFIDVNEETFVSYRFETAGDVVEFGDGRLIVDIEVDEVQGNGGADPRKGVMENAREALPFSLEDTLSLALANAGSSLDATSAYHGIIDSYATAADALDPTVIHCDDQVSGGQASLNGFPIQCGRLESQQFDNIGAWFPLAAVNRLDLAPADGANCGQQRIIFANNSFIGNGRMFMILESEVPNPDPACGVSACAPIAAFWTELGQMKDPFQRGERLREAFLTGSPELAAAGFSPFMNAAQLGSRGGQIRTNNFNDSPWALREFHFQDVNAPPVPVPVSEAPNGALWNDLSTLPQGPACRDSFLAAAELGLLTDNLAAMSFPIAEACKDAESRNDFSQDYVGELSQGSGSFGQQLAALGAPFGVSAEELAARARFAGSCIGCHMEASGSSLGNGLTAPFQSDFVQVSEFGQEPCGNGGTCFTISDALRNVFLPHRLRVTQNLLNGPVCGGEVPPGFPPPPVEQPGSGPVSGTGGGSASGSSEPADPNVRYTLGGQLVDDHAH
jgi:hypothetical protein